MVEEEKKKKILGFKCNPTSVIQKYKIYPPKHAATLTKPLCVTLALQSPCLTEQVGTVPTCGLPVRTLFISESLRTNLVDFIPQNS